MIILSTFVSGWLIGCAAAAPLPEYDILFAHGDAPRAAAAAGSETMPAAQNQAEREREQRLREAQREREQRLREAQRQREEQQREREQQLREAQREREQQQREAQREREQQQREAQRDREERAREHAQRVRERRRDEYQEVQGERITRTFPVGRDGSLLLHNISGDIIVTGASGTEIKVDAVKKAKGRTAAEARQQLENVQVTIQGAGNRVDVATEHRGRESRGWVEFHVMVPYDARVELHSVSGDITVTGVKGELRAETVSGDVRATSLSRLVLLKSLSGDVEINGAESDGMIALSSVSGDVNATNLKARGVEVSSVSGDTVLNGCACDRAQINTVNGSVQYSGRLSKTGRYELKSHSGDLTLYHQGSPFDLAASTFSGDIRFDPAIPTTLKNVSNRYGPGRSVRGAVGGGGAYVELTTFSGDITVGAGGGGGGK